MAAYAEFLDLCLNQNHLSVLRGGMALLTLALGERIMDELLQQLGTVRLVRIVTFQAVCLSDGLTTVGLDEVRILGVVAIEAERRRSLGYVKLPGYIFSNLMIHMAAVTT